MTINVSSLSGGGGLLKISSAALGGTIVSGTTADFTISCPAGKYVRLTILDASGGNQNGVSLSVGARPIFSSSAVSPVGPVTGTNVKIGQRGGTNDGYTQASILGGRSEDFVFSFDAATSRNLNYAYEVLEDD